jgi:uncharacterized SAM-dependent methyltransferase
LDFGASGAQKLVGKILRQHNPNVLRPADITIHPSQFPENVQRDLLESLRSRRVNHKFHYDSVKQTQKWLALHEAYSPARTDTDCQRTYDRSFVAATQRITATQLHLIGLGCGGGQKDTRLLKHLKARERILYYTPSDVSTAMVLVARRAALKIIPTANCFPFVCDLATATDVPRILDNLACTHWPSRNAQQVKRLFTFFGMIPNFEPQIILPRLASLLRRGDFLLFSANLAPGPDYAAGVRQILPLYDNELTRDWLLTFLFDLGVEKKEGQLDFVIEEDRVGLKRITAYFRFVRSRTIIVNSESFRFRRGESIRLFFSYRHTPASVRQLLARYRLKILDQWITKSAEEGVFLCARQ